MLNTFIHVNRNTNARIGIDVVDIYDRIRTINNDDTWGTELGRKLCKFFSNKSAFTKYRSITRREMFAGIFGRRFTNPNSTITQVNALPNPSETAQNKRYEAEAVIRGLDTESRAAVCSLQVMLKKSGAYLHRFRSNGTTRYCIALCPPSVTEALSENKHRHSRAQKNINILTFLESRV